MILNSKVVRFYDYIQFIIIDCYGKGLNLEENMKGEEKE